MPTPRSRSSRMMRNSSSISAIGQRGGRLVHDEHLGVEGERLGDLHHLLLGHGESLRPCVRGSMSRCIVEQLCGLAVDLPLVEQKPEPWRGSRPMKMFCATVRCGIRFSSWWMMLIPRSLRARVGWGCRLPCPCRGSAPRLCDRRRPGSSSGWTCPRRFRPPAHAPRRPAGRSVHWLSA